MKVNVVRKDGAVETITLTDPVKIVRGDYQNRIQTATGMDHWFSLDGAYDGWGQGVSCSPDEAKAIIEENERDREFPSAEEPK